MDAKKVCARCGTEQDTSRVREPTDPSVCFERHGRRYTWLTLASILCDPCAYAMTDTFKTPLAPGCPRHPTHADRRCQDMRCLRTWVPEGAPTPDEQLERWAKGDAVCPNTKHECCPDFGCCKPTLAWPPETRAKFVAAPQGEREKMMMGALGALASAAAPGTKTYVSRGDPSDRE